MTPWTVRDSEADHGTFEVRGAYLVADHLPIEDARLIAAAPDLYEALADALEQLKAYEMELSGESYNSPKINAALAKARGEQ